MYALFFCVCLLSSITVDVVYGDCVSADGPFKIPKGITVHKVIASWEEAKQQCESEGAVLASPLTTELLNSMISLIGVNNTEYFIGTKANAISGVFESVEGVPLDNMTAAVVEMIQQIDPRDGDCLSMDQDNIRVVPCCTRLPFMCFNVQMANNVQIDCGTDDEGYELYKSTGSCYKRHLELALWEDANKTCVAEGGHLAIIENDFEAQVLKEMSFPPKRDWYVYIGLRNYGEMNGWRSVNGQSVSELYNSWIDGTGLKSPNFCCGLLKFTGQLDWDTCWDHKHPFICEKPINYH